MQLPIDAPGAIPQASALTAHANGPNYKVVHTLALLPTMAQSPSRA
jgi:hypothetical protein